MGLRNVVFAFCFGKERSSGDTSQNRNAVSEQAAVETHKSRHAGTGLRFGRHHCMELNISDISANRNNNNLEGGLWDGLPISTNSEINIIM